VTFAPKCKAPAIFLHAVDDEFITMVHTEENYEAYGGEKEAVYCEGDHNSAREGECLEAITQFLLKNLG
jgi:hypothetical protein